MNDSICADGTGRITIDDADLVERVHRAVEQTDMYDSPEDVLRDALEGRLSDAAVSVVGPTEAPPIRDAGFTRTVQVDVQLTEDQWDHLRCEALRQVHRGVHSHHAFWDTVYEHITTTPNIVVDGEVVGPEDVVLDDE